VNMTGPHACGSLSTVRAAWHRWLRDVWPRRQVAKPRAISILELDMVSEYPRMA
jgi:hypothetical protein